MANRINNVTINYSELNKADETLVCEIIQNAIKTQETSEKTLYHKDIAQIVKTELDSQKGGSWNVIVGKSFGSYVTHETKTMIRLFVGNVAFLIWKHT